MTEPKNGRRVLPQSWTIVNDHGQMQLLPFANNALAFPSFSIEDLAIRFVKHTEPFDGPVPFEITSLQQLLGILKSVKSQNGCTHVAFDPIHAKQSTTELPIIDGVIAAIEGRLSGN